MLLVWTGLKGMGGKEVRRELGDGEWKEERRGGGVFRPRL